MLTQVSTKLIWHKIFVFAIGLHLACSFVTKYCKVNKDCSSKEFCSISRVCLCIEGLVPLPGAEGLSCEVTKGAGEVCDHDVQCHQNRKLGFICEGRRCVCPNNAKPINGRCPSLSSQVTIPVPQIENDQLTPSFLGAHFDSKTLLVIGVITILLMALAMAFVFFHLVCRRSKSSTLTTPSTEIEESTTILHREGRTSRPPSYSSLPPPSYDESSLLPAGVVAWWRGLTVVPENDAEIHGASADAACLIASTNQDEGCCKPLLSGCKGSNNPSNSSPSAPLLSHSLKPYEAVGENKAFTLEETKL